jgi:hypothetical protein
MSDRLLALANAPLPDAQRAESRCCRRRHCHCQACCGCQVHSPLHALLLVVTANCKRLLQHRLAVCPVPQKQLRAQEGSS